MKEGGTSMARKPWTGWNRLFSLFLHRFALTAAIRWMYFSVLFTVQRQLKQIGSSAFVKRKNEGK